MSDDTPLARIAADLGQRLQARGWFLVTAESCTGGGISAAVTAIAGSSAWFDCGLVTYSYAAKTRLLGVPQALLARVGAVSEPVVEAMAHGALANSGAQVAVAVSGIAGPGGGQPGKPVGTVCFAWVWPGQPVRTETRHFSGDRAAVQAQAVRHALSGFDLPAT